GGGAGWGTGGGSREPLPRELDESVGCAGGRASGGANEGDLTGRVKPLHAGDRERAGGEVGLDRGARDEGDAVAGRDSRAGRLLQPELEARLEVAEPGARAAGLVLDHLAHARTLLHHDQRRPAGPAG